MRFTALCWCFYCQLVLATAVRHALGQLPWSLKHLPFQVVESFMNGCPPATITSWLYQSWDPDPGRIS